MPNHEDTDEGERLDLEGLYSGRELPPDLEERVVRDLVEVGIIGRPRRRWMTWATRLAAGLILFTAGWRVGDRRSEPVDIERPSFVLLLWEGPNFGSGAPVGSFSDEYADWAESVAALDVTISGNELGPDREMIVPEGGGLLSDRDLGGYFLLEAEDVATARVIAEGHPHLRHGGWIELAPIVGPSGR